MNALIALGSGSLALAYGVLSSNAVPLAAASLTNYQAHRAVDFLFGNVFYTVLTVLVVGMFVLSIVLMIAGTTSDATQPSTFGGLGLRTNDETLGLGIILFLISVVFLLSTVSIGIEEHRMIKDTGRTRELMKALQAPENAGKLIEDAQSLGLTPKQYLLAGLEGIPAFDVGLKHAYEQNENIARSDLKKEVKKYIVKSLATDKSTLRDKKGLKRSERKQLLEKYYDDANPGFKSIVVKPVKQTIGWFGSFVDKFLNFSSPLKHFVSRVNNTHS